MKRLFLSIAVVLLAGCATPSSQDMANLDYGPYPENYKDIVQTYFSTRLKDPSSALIDFRAGPTQVFKRGSLLGPQAHGWGVCLFVNAKNSYGGYVGRRTLALLIRNGAVVQADGDMGTNTFDTAVAKGMCRQIGESAP